MSDKPEEKEEDYYLSDIHCENTSFMNLNSTNELKISRIELIVPIITPSAKVTHDSDGDLLLERESNKYLFQIEHHLKTILKDVGLQIWRASFYLMDFLIWSSNLIDNQIVVELGAGLGIASMTASLFAQTVFCTDLPVVVKQAERNYQLNETSLTKSNIRFRSLVWSDCLSEPQFFDFTENDLNIIKNANVFIAADVVYDDLITIKLMNTLYKLLTLGDTKTRKCCFISGEKRINFNINNLDETDCAYNYFKQCLLELDDYFDSLAGVQFKVTQLDCSQMPQFVLNYERNSFLYIWKLEMIPI